MLSYTQVLRSNHHLRWEPPYPQAVSSTPRHAGAGCANLDFGRALSISGSCTRLSVLMGEPLAPPLYMLGTPWLCRLKDDPILRSRRDDSSENEPNRSYSLSGRWRLC